MVRNNAARFAGLFLALLAGCERDPVPPAAAVEPAPPIASASAPAVPSPKADEPSPIDASTFARLFRELSEPDQYFFSDNFVSNETSYLQVAHGLKTRATPGGAYLGVGPEQNFTYIAISRPALAFIVDIRRQNALEHLLYKAIFDEADSRAAFLCLLLGSACTGADEASLGSVLEVADAAWQRRDHAAFSALHEQLRKRIEERYQIPLSKADRESIERVHRAFFEKGLSLAFELYAENHRDYPPLRALLQATSPDGSGHNFLASEEDFRWLKRMQQKNRIIPVVGDFAGDHALQGIAAELKRRGLTVSVFYTSNVEQYLLEPPKWQRWVKNVAAQPSSESSLFLRCYLDQGRRHPQQLAGHRTASVLMHFDHFRDKQRGRGYTGFWQLATDGVIAD